jgi:tetratricopeptide (TPR) repeat protein
MNARDVLRAARRVLAVACVAVSTSCSAPPVEDLPAGYVRAEREGIVFYFRPGDEPWIDEMLPAVRATRAKLAPVAARLKEDLEQCRGMLGVVGSSLEDGDLGKKLLERVIDAVGPGETEVASMRSVWSGALRLLTPFYQNAFSSLLKIVSIEAVRIVTTAEILHGDVRLVAYDAEAPRLNINYSMRGESNGETTMRDASGRVFSASQFDLALPLHKDPLPNGRTWRESLGLFAPVPADLERSSILGKLAEFHFLPSSTGEVAIVPLHETAEVGLVTTFQIREPLARWFHDGMANYLAHEAIREVLGENAYAKLPYSPGDGNKYADARADVNLLAWPRADFDKYRSTSSSDAHYYFATEEIRGLAERHGKDFIKKLLAALKDQRPVDTEKICAAVKSLTGENFLARLESYLPATSENVTDVESRVEEWEAREPAKAIPLLESLVERFPRDVEYRCRLAMALLNDDGEKHLSEFLFHYLLYASLASSRGFGVREPDVAQDRRTASTYYAMARLCETQDDVKNAEECYARVLELDPKHAASRERLQALRARVQK